MPQELVHHLRDSCSGAAAHFAQMREAKRENTRCGLRPMSDKAAGQKARSPKGCNENRPAAALLLSHVSSQICSFVAPCRWPHFDFNAAVFVPKIVHLFVRQR